MRFKDLILSLKQFDELKHEKLNNKLTHAYMFVSSDPVLLQEFSNMFASLVMCKTQGVCGECVNCQKIALNSHPDVTCLPKGDKVYVEDIEKLIEESIVVPLEADCKVYIIDNFSSANTQAQNKLLKTLETPPKNVYIVLNVTNESNILPTIASRCKKIRLNNLTSEQIESAVLPICKDPSKAQTIGYISEGSLTRALNFADNENFMQNYLLTCDVIKNLKNSTTVLPLSASLNERKIYLGDILEIMESLYRDMLMIRLQKIDYITNKNEQSMLEQVANDYSCDAIDLIIKHIYHTKAELNFNVNPTTLIDNLLLYILEVKHLCK